MSNEKEIPRVSLQTLVMAIQIIEREIDEIEKVIKEDGGSANDDIWHYDLVQAAENLKEVYIYEVKDVINFPTYEALVKKIK